MIHYLMCLKHMHLINLDWKFNLPALRLFCTFLVAEALILPKLAKAQINYPQTDILMEQNIKTIKVYRKALKFIGGPSEERKKMGLPDSTRKLYLVYHINDFGYADSVLSFQKHIYRYDHQDIVEYDRIGNDGRIRFHSELIKTDSGMVFKTWEFGKLKTISRFNTDSILIEQFRFNGRDSAWRSALFFDPDSNLRTEHWRGDKGFYKIETYQWFTQDGKASTFRHTLEHRKEGRSKIIKKEKTYALDSAGNVVNKYLGRFDDPYIRYNYFDRFKKLDKATFYGQQKFIEDHLPKYKLNEELYTFSGISMVVKYEFEYEYRSKN